MKTYNDILNAQQNFAMRREAYLELNYKFFLNLIKQVGEKGKIPDGGLIKYQKGTRNNINIVEEWIELNDDGSCSMQIGIITNEVYHDVHLSTNKQKSKFILSVTTDIGMEQFEYDLTTQKVEGINFDDVVESIFAILINYYDTWSFGQ